MSESIEIYDLPPIPRPAHLGGGTWILKTLTPITIILGRNGSGKSQLLRAIRDKDVQSYYYCVPERDGQTVFEVQLAHQERDYAQRAKSSAGNFAHQYRQMVVSKIDALMSKIGHAKETVEPMKIRSDVEAPINKLFSDFNFKITDSTIPYLLTRKSGQDVTNKSELLSSGETQIFTLGLDLVLTCQMWKLDHIRGTLLIDEPDLHLHPELQQKFAEFINSLNEQFNFPIIISTHSTTFLSALGYYGKNKSSIIYLKNIEELQAIKFSKSLMTLSTCLGGHALMGPLFHFPILLVEGDDDYKSWSEIPRHNEIPLSVIPCGGSDEMKQYQKTLESLFSSLVESSTEPSGYALLDGDKDIPEVSQEHVQYLKLSCHEIENLYLTNEVLDSMDIDWETARKRVIEKSSNHGEKTTFLQSINEWDRKTVDCKSVINELQWILDDKNVHWTLRIGQVLGRNTPQGQLAEFLGNDLVNAIWKIPENHS